MVEKSRENGFPGPADNHPLSKTANVPTNERGLLSESRENNQKTANADANAQTMMSKIIAVDEEKPNARARRAIGYEEKTCIEKSDSFCGVSVVSTLPEYGEFRRGFPSMID